MEPLSWLVALFLPYAELRPQPAMAPESLPASVATQTFVAALHAHFPPAEYRHIKVQPIGTMHGGGHVLVYLASKRYHRVDFARVTTDESGHILSVTKDYDWQDADFAAQERLTPFTAKCPDDTVEFITIVPNKDPEEQGYAKTVAAAARAHGLKTVELYAEAGTRANYLNYMVCPRLRGNFYDGDSDKKSIDTFDGTITHQDIHASLYHQFNYQVTNVWVACEAYNNPLLATMLDDAQAKKYAAGKNDLDIGPSDQTAVCAMQAFLDGKPMTDSFQDCFRLHDDAHDRWGFGGNGTDYF